MRAARAADGAEEGGWVPRSDGFKIGAGVWFGWRQRVEVGRRLDRLNYVVDSDRKEYCEEEADPASKLPFCDLRSNWIQLAGLFRNRFNKFKKNRKEVGDEHILFSMMSNGPMASSNVQRDLAMR